MPPPSFCAQLPVMAVPDTTTLSAAASALPYAPPTNRPPPDPAASAAAGRRGGRAFRVSRNGQVVFRAAARARHRRVAGNGAARKPHDALTHVRQRAVFAPVAGDGAARHVQGAHVVDGARAAVVLRLPPVAGVEALHLRAGGAAVAAVAVARHGARVALDGAAAQVQRARVVDGARHRRHAACDGHAVVHGERAALQNLDGAGVQLGVVGVVLDGDAAVQREFAVRTHLEERAPRWGWTGCRQT